jgi:hypothetical protein
MYAFYLVRGKNLNDLINLSYVEKIYYFEAMQLHKDEEEEKYKKLFGDGK